MPSTYVMWSLSSSDSNEEEEVVSGNEERQTNRSLPLLALAVYVDECVDKAPRRPRKIPYMSGIQWVELKLQDPKEFYNMFRTRMIVFRMLHDTLVSNYGLKSNPSICSREALSLFLWTVGSSQSNSQAADRFEHCGWTISKRFGEVLECLYNFAGDVIRPRDPTFSTPHPRLQNRRFWPHFKDAIGAIDRTHIKIVVPANLKVVHINSHGDTSENVMAICDFDMRFTFVVAGWPGSVHDTRVFDDAKVTYPNYPHPPPGKYYLVDSRYPNRTRYLAPYEEQRYHVPEFQHHEPVGMKEVFNHRHSSLRNVIERSFGYLKMKWRILRDLPSYLVDKQKMIIVACMALHNFIRDSALRDEHFERFKIEEYYQDDVAGGVGVHNAPSSNDDGTMGQKLDEIAQSLMAGR